MEIILILIFLVVCSLTFYVLKNDEVIHLKKYFEHSRCKDAGKRIELIKEWEVEAFKIAYPKTEIINDTKANARIANTSP